MGVINAYELDGQLRPVAILRGVRSLTVERSVSSDSSLVQSATIEVDSESWAGGWVGIEASDPAVGDLGAFLFEVSSSKLSDGMRTVSADGRSVLCAADEMDVETGSYVAGGADAVAFAASMLSVCPSQVYASGFAVLPESVVFGKSTSRLAAAWQVLRSVGYGISLGERIEVAPVPTEPSLYVTESDSRGVTGDVSAKGDELSWSRVVLDELAPLDVVHVELPRLGVSGDYRLMSQSLKFGATIIANETLMEVSSGY